MDYDYTEEVQRGAKLLDEKLPGWAHRLTLDKLQMRSCSQCVLGQLYYWYLEGQIALDLDFDDEDVEVSESVRHGFDIKVRPPRWGEDENTRVASMFEALERAWHVEITARTQEAT